MSREAAPGADGMKHDETRRTSTAAFLAGGHMPLSDEESLLCEESEEDEFDLTEVVIHQVDDMCRLCMCNDSVACTTTLPDSRFGCISSLGIEQCLIFR